MDSPVFARTTLSCAGSPLIVALGVLLLVGCTEEPRELPEHAYTTFGDSWKCERGFKRVEDECQSVEVPEHAFLSHYGDVWTCERSFRRVEDECQPVEVPEHAFLGHGDWTCERGFKRAEDECQSIKVPEHAFLTDSSWGDGWKCERGFKREGNRCSPE